MSRIIQQILLLASLVVALVGCLPVEADPIPASASPIPATTAETAISTSPDPTATRMPPTPVTELTASFGDPVALGRGGIRDAAFSPGLATLAIGWTKGVSLVEVNDLEELWFRETPQMVTALDLTESAIAAVLVTGDVWLFDTKNGEGLLFAGAASADSYWGDVAWSPDGSLAAYVDIDGQDLLVVNADRSDAMYLAGGVFRPPIWRP